ncbi:MAG: phage tail sheath subtilisin-like domain-containing protein [Alphaproteobacteria bacterium]|nr:phage tail sheath subtilisin-like domain-containing protein [Alphaproteobacteria bacterium]
MLNHGITINEVASGPQAASTVSTSVIGIVLVSPDADSNLLHYPVSTPVRLTEYATIDDDLSATAAQSIHDIYRQTRAEVVIVRVAAAADVAPATDDGTGVYALKVAESSIGYKPKIILAPGNGESDYAALKAVADSLRAIALIDLDSVDGATAVTDAAVLSASGSGSSRCLAVWPQVKATAGGTPRSAAPFVAGAIAKKDAARGYWWSPSNTAIDGVADLDISVSDEVADALNDAKVATFRRYPTQLTIWGNKSLFISTLSNTDSASDGVQYQFIAVRRVADAIYDTLDRALAWAQDRPISANLTNDIQEYVNAYLATLRAQGAILNGRCLIDPSRNPPSALAEGNLVVDIDFEPPAPAQKITIRATRNETYYEEVIG